MKYLSVILALIVSLYGGHGKYNIAPLINAKGIEKPVVICIPSYNNEKFYKLNLDSIFKQNYTNYRVIYVDDASNDNTALLVSEYIKENHLKNKIELISNEVNKGALKNLYDMIHSCNDDAIIVCLDGDDWFKHDQVLLRINSAYQNPNVWVTYGQYVTYPDSWKGHCKKVSMKVLKGKKHRENPFIWSHLRTFYAGLFKKIPISSFMGSDGEFFSMGWDVAIMCNLIDMGPCNIFFIPDVLYVYNTLNPLNDFKIDSKKQIDTEEYIKKMAPLKEVSTWR